MSFWILVIFQVQERLLNFSLPPSCIGTLTRTKLSNGKGQNGGPLFLGILRRRHLRNAADVRWNLCEKYFYALLLPVLSSFFCSLHSFPQVMTITLPMREIYKFAVARQVCNLLIIPLDMLDATPTAHTVHTHTHWLTHSHWHSWTPTHLFRHFVIFNLCLSLPELLEAGHPSEGLLPAPTPCSLCVCGAFPKVDYKLKALVIAMLSQIGDGCYGTEVRFLHRNKEVIN